MNKNRSQSEILLTEAQNLHRSGKLELACSAYSKLLAPQSDIGHDHAAFMACEGLATLILRLGKPMEALPYIEKLVAVKPQAMIYHSHHGAALLGLSRYDEAIAAYKIALDLTENAINHDNLAGAYREKRDYSAAIAHHRAALAMASDSAAIAIYYNNYATTCIQAERFQDAFDILSQLLNRYPTHSLGWHNLGHCLRCLGHADLGLVASQKALSIDPEYAPARFNMALCQLAMGDTVAGFSAYESREQIMKQTRHNGLDPAKIWRGENLGPSGILLLQAEQGFGDTVQFARYALNAKNHARQIILRVQPELIPLLAHSLGDQYIYASTEAPPPAHSRHCLMLSLPRWIPRPQECTPYLKIPKLIQERWRDRLTRWKDRFRIGLVWSGNPQHVNDRIRSLAFDELASALAGLPDDLKERVAFFSLQKEGAPTQTETALSIINFSEELNDFTDTAAALQELDLLISVDTAAAHLAGALSRPCWVFLAYAVDWRWGLGGESTPWYPSLRLFREPAPGQRAATLSGMTAVLAETIRSGTSFLPHVSARDFPRMKHSPTASKVPDQILRLLADVK